MGVVNEKGGRQKWGGKSSPARHPPASAPATPWAILGRAPASVCPSILPSIRLLPAAEMKPDLM